MRATAAAAAARAAAARAAAARAAAARRGRRKEPAARAAAARAAAARAAAAARVAAARAAAAEAKGFSPAAAAGWGWARVREGEGGWVLGCDYSLVLGLQELLVQDRVLLDEGDDEVGILGEVCKGRELGDVLNEQIQDVHVAAEKEQVLVGRHLA